METTSTLSKISKVTSTTKGLTLLRNLVIVGIQNKQKSLMLNLSGNNNSISSLKLSDRMHLIEDTNNSRIDTFYSPVNRERSNTTESICDAVLNKWKSSNSISSNEYANASYHKKPDALNTPYRNIYSSNAKYDATSKIKPDSSDPVTSQEERCETLESSTATITK